MDAAQDKPCENGQCSVLPREQVFGGVVLEKLNEEHGDQTKGTQ